MCLISAHSLPFQLIFIFLTHIYLLQYLMYCIMYISIYFYFLYRLSRSGSRARRSRISLPLNVACVTNMNFIKNDRKLVFDTVSFLISHNIYWLKILTYWFSHRRSNKPLSGLELCSLICLFIYVKSNITYHGNMRE